MESIKKVKIVVLIVFVLFIIAIIQGCKGSDIKGDWSVKIKYNELAKREVIPENSIFTFGSKNIFYINGDKIKEKYKKKGNIIRIKTKFLKRKYVIRGKIINKNTMKGEIKKILTDDEIGFWTAKRK